MAEESVGRLVDDSSCTPGSLDPCLRVLAHRSRRSAVSYLCRTEASVPVEELVDHVADDVNESRETVAVMFHHSHLPKMEGAGVVEYDRGEETVSLSSSGADLEVLLTVL